MTYTITLNDGRQICFSYGVPVAVYIPSEAEALLIAAGLVPRGYYCTKEQHSKTTTKHINNFASRNATPVDPAVLRVLIDPIARGSM